ncbi:MAG TPA: HD domain-containing phosphohydrolase [Candidatus Saccharimonadales bacterium]|jgi:HD-GYP domain-containing protein (c-di-GMP phosphodiesterase class II)|nr:HD domain-containing phosphohydrolase [Candidatus Saccharimonadales bacterium]
MSGPLALPIIAYFAEDAVAARLPSGAQRFRRMPFEKIEGEIAALERIVLVSKEELVERHYAQLRAPNIRVLALVRQKFKDARNDGAVYAYLPPDIPSSMLERIVDNALDHIHLVQSRQKVNDQLAGASQEIHELNKIGVALSAEHETHALMEMILTKARELTHSDAGSIYLVERAPLRGQRRIAFTSGKPVAEGLLFEEHMRFCLAQNDTVDLPFREVSVEINKRSLAGYVALTGEIINVEDAYHLPAGVPYAINRQFDTDSGYRTRSILCVPMHNQKGKIVGVLQLLNAKRDPAVKLASLAAVAQQVVPFSARQQELVVSLASQAAVALENSRLYEDIRKLFEGFVRASVTAIEARDPATSGHSFRVANLTVALAEVVDRNDGPGFRDVRFSRDEMREIRYASLLHDVGKVGVKEEVLVKAKKLYPAQLELIEQRFGFVKRTLENESLQSKINYLLEKGRDEFLAKQKDFDGELAAALKGLDEHFQSILRANEPTVQPEGEFRPLAKIGAIQYHTLEGSSRPLLMPEEIKLLSIRKGSLDEEERLLIEAHVVYSFNFLQQIPWTSELRQVPEIARLHHEKLNGGGYPYKLSAPGIPVQTRMMTISDIFDALAAPDRPYKKSISMERALDILTACVHDGEIDGGLFDLFREAKVYERWKVEPFPY